MNAEPMPSSPNENDHAPARICITKDDAAKMKVGSSVTLTVSGAVKGLHPMFDHKDMYEVEIENPEVEVESEDDDTNEDESAATMPREKLKKMISKSSDEE